jgi:hypothetical protein
MFRCCSVLPENWFYTGARFWKSLPGNFKSSPVVRQPKSPVNDLKHTFARRLLPMETRNVLTGDDYNGHRTGAPFGASVGGAAGSNKAGV